MTVKKVFIGSVRQNVSVAGKRPPEDIRRVQKAQSSMVNCVDFRHETPKDAGSCLLGIRGLSMDSESLPPSAGYTLPASQPFWPPTQGKHKRFYTLQEPYSMARTAETL
jgi:hypothetical protein